MPVAAAMLPLPQPLPWSSTRFFSSLCPPSQRAAAAARQPGSPGALPWAAWLVSGRDLGCMGVGGAEGSLVKESNIISVF